MNIDNYLINVDEPILEAMKLIEVNKKGFIIVEENNKIYGTITDGDIRRGILKGFSLTDTVRDITNTKFEMLKKSDTFHTIVDKFKSEKIDFLPVVNELNEVVNVLTKEQLHEILLEGLDLNLEDDFNKFSERIITHEIYNRPWGFYKTVFLSEYAQAKIIHVHPLHQLSLQFHKKREEHWVVVKGQGEMIIGESIRKVNEGTYIFIPKGCQHRVKNLSNVHPLIISEVQLGSYFGEDDIIRIQDNYGRN